MQSSAERISSLYESRGVTSSKLYFPEALQQTFAPKSDYAEFTKRGAGAYPVSSEHLSPVLVDDLDDAGRLDPGLAVHLDRNALLPQDGDLDLTTLKMRQSRKAAAVRGRFQM